MPGLKVRRAETTVELPSGGSMIMAGLIQDTVKQHINGTPGLKNLPILGTLFRSRDFQADETELVVIVTPYVVNPVNEKQLATPFERFNMPTDRQTILFGRLNKIYGVAGGAQGHLPRQCRVHRRVGGGRGMKTCANSQLAALGRGTCSLCCRGCWLAACSRRGDRRLLQARHAL